MIKVGIIGCGRIADQHAVGIVKMRDCELVGVCDTEELMAKQLYERFAAKAFFRDAGELLEKARPDVVHLTTPPQSHLALGKLCLASGANVFFEKPFAMNTKEVEELISYANKRNLKITVGHNIQFTHAACQTRRLIREGFLGGPPIHIESVWCYSLKDPGYTKAVLGEKNHWVRGLPGKLLHNIISHGVSKIAEFMSTDSPVVKAVAYSSQVMRRAGELDISDELRTIIRGDNDTTAYFTFSTQIEPPIHQLRIFGPKNSLIVDDLNQTVIKVEGNLRSYLNHFLPPIRYARQYFNSSLGNIMRFIKRESYLEEGRNRLTEGFYQAVSQGKDVPIPYREILLTSRIMDGIFAQIRTPRD